MPLVRIAWVSCSACWRACLTIASMTADGGSSTRRRRNSSITVPASRRGWAAVCATGIASWYGPKFHGLSTANGETYDMDRVSAAHKTLPLPSYVEVTNLENGRRIIARVNDRGPFVGDRVIDLSRRSAELLDVVRQGTAKVRVRPVFPPYDVRLAPPRGGKSWGAGEGR